MFFRKYGKLIESVLLCGMIAVVVVPLLLTSFFALPTADDFYNANQIRQLLQENPNVLSVAVSATLEGYFTRGYAPIVFFNFLLSPLLHFGLTGLRVTIFMISAMFVVSLFFFVKWTLVFLFRDQNVLHTLILYFLTVFGLIGFKFSPEIFEWITCSFGYLLPIDCMLLGLAFFVKASAVPKTRYWVLSAVLGGIGAMGPTHISALVCGLYLVSFLLTRMYRRPLKAPLIVLLVVLLVGVLGICAPGIYQRHSSFSSQYYLMNSITQSFVYAYNETVSLLFRSPFGVVLALVTVCAFRWVRVEKPVPWQAPLLQALFFLFAPAVVVFPELFGYNMNATDFMPTRSIFVFDLTIIIACVALVFSAAAYFRSRCTQEFLPRKSFLPLATVLALFFGFVALSFPLNSYPPLKYIDDFWDGEIARTNHYWDTTLSAWSRSAGQDVKVDQTSQDVLRLQYFVYPIVSDDPNNWVNSAIADLYGLKSIQSVTDTDR